jgi:chromosomal replication initiation ATPase DnaA
MRADTVAREMALPRADVDHVVSVCSEWLRRTQTSMIADIASCADVIAANAFVEASPVIDGFTEYSLAEVLRAVMGFYGIDAEALSGPSRTGDLVQARCVYACAARRATRATLVRIGESINRHHSTLIPHIRATEECFAAHHGYQIDFSGS